MGKKDLTPRQRSILEFLTEFTGDKGFPPTLREISHYFKIKGPKNARKHLDALERKGFIRRSPHRSRAIEVPAVRRGVRIPVAGQVRAGSPDLAVEDILGHVTLDARFFPGVKDAFLLRVQGESMKDAGLEDGDHVMVKPGPDVLSGDIVVALMDGEATVKRFLKEGDAVILKPENPDFRPIRIGKERMEFLNIIGKVVFVIKKV